MTLLDSFKLSLSSVWRLKCHFSLLLDCGGLPPSHISCVTLSFPVMVKAKQTKNLSLQSEFPEIND